MATLGIHASSVMRKFTSMTSMGLLLVLLIVPQVTDSVQIIRCDSVSFYNPQLRACQICRKCPKDEIIREPCSTLSDTKCGPFEEFDASELEHVQPKIMPHNPQEGAASGLVPPGPNTSDNGATRDYRRVSWTNILLISLGFFMTVAALISILVILARMLRSRKHCRLLQYTTGGPNLVIVKQVDGVQQSTIAWVSPLMRPREELNPLYEVTHSNESVESRKPLFPFKLPRSDTDSGIGQ